jgi:hypothetical protein
MPGTCNNTTGPFIPSCINVPGIFSLDSLEEEGGKQIHLRSLTANLSQRHHRFTDLGHCRDRASKEEGVC